MMSLSQYQKNAQRTAVYPNDGETGITYTLLALCGEAGEAANIRKKSLRSGEPLTPKQKADIIDELGDCLYYIAASATELGVDLSEVAHRNQHKLAIRYQLD